VKHAIAIDILEWDSSFFGYSVGRIRNCPRHLSQIDIRNVMQENNLQLLYCLTSEPLSEVFASFYVVTQVTYEQLLDDTGHEPPKTTEVNVYPYPCQAATKELQLLAYEAGWSSRFQMDSHVSQDQFRNMYDQWIDRSCKREIADTVLISECADRLAGFITLAKHNDILQIGLLAVAKPFRGQGIGNLLIHNAIFYASHLGCKRIRVITQENNTAAIKLYEKTGMQLAKTHYCYHFWSRDLVE
jgi:ribosomal protein S18 acetylase RimI-like enzyme